jgi:signal peptide peptidase SppA
MANPFKMLARLWARTDNTVIGQLYTHCLGRPLFVEPRIGAELLEAYMRGPVPMMFDDDDGDTTPREPDKGYRSAGTVAVMDIQGALASRPMPGPSGGGPQNYEQLAATFAQLVDDPAVSAIVLRLDSPGGFAAGLFDFTDQIAAARAKKPVHAVIDDMAYSAAYAIAAAAGEIWVSRTAGAGSIGVVAYHVDRSGADKAEGIKITPIYAGARKIDFSPHFPLSEEALALEQAEVDRLYGMFVESVGRYRGDRLSAAAARATDAGIASGPVAVQKGFADRIGTLHDALAFLATKTEPTLPVVTEGPAMDETAIATQKKGALAIAVTAAALPAAVAQALLATDVEVADIETRVAHAREITGICEVAKVPELAAGIVTRNVPLEAARKEIQDKLAGDDERRRTDPTLPIGSGGLGKRPGAWDKVITKMGGKP